MQRPSVVSDTFKATLFKIYLQKVAIVFKEKICVMNINTELKPCGSGVLLKKCFKLEKC